MNKGTAFLGWSAAAAGIVLVYAAYKNVSPVAIVRGTLTGNPDRPLIDSTVGTGIKGVGSTVSTGGKTPVPASTTVHERARRLQDREIQPLWVPIPTQPTMKLDAYAVSSFLQVQSEYGQKLWLTGAQRTYAEQNTGYASDPNRFAPPGKSGHEVGIAIDLDTNKVNVNDTRLNDIFAKHGWFTAGRSGAMHKSWGVAA